MIDGRVTPPIYVSLDVADRIVWAVTPPFSAPSLAGVVVPRVVGRAIAHELAHVLLDTRAHAPRGVTGYQRLTTSSTSRSARSRS